MRATSVLRVVLALKHTRVVGFELDDDGLVVDVAPTWKLPRCVACKKVVHSGYDAREADDGSVVVAAVQASTLLPPGAPDPFWPAGLEVSTADIGCIAYGCDDESAMTMTGRAIRVGLGGDVADFAGGEAGTVPGTFDGPAPTIAVQEAREGACGINLGDQSGWTSLVIVRPQ